MKKFSCYIIIAILAAIVFFEIKDAVTGKRDFFIHRWVSWALYSNKEYANNIVVKPYLLNDEQAAQMLAHPEQDILQPAQKDLYLKSVNLALRISNQGEKAAWGVLAYRTSENNDWVRLEVAIPSSKSEVNKQVYDYVLPLGVVVPFNNNNPPEHIQYKWFSLNTK